MAAMHAPMLKAQNARLAKLRAALGFGQPRTCGSCCHLGMLPSSIVAAADRASCDATLAPSAAAPPTTSAEPASGPAAWRAADHAPSAAGPAATAALGAVLGLLCDQREHMAAEVQRLR